jgi:hypothetical protein
MNVTYSARTSSDCGCGGSSSSSDQHAADQCTARSLPINPFEDLNASYGMLLGTEDFNVLMGNPRGKQRLHNAWLHGRGVVWGMYLSLAGSMLKVHPGLAIDGVGRELRVESDQCIDLETWAKKWIDEHQDPDHRDPGDPHTGHHDCGDHDGSNHDDSSDEEDACTTRVAKAWVVAEFGCCLTSPVPVIADPCDVTRTQTTSSRIIETANIRLVDRRPCEHHSYHRVRVLLGLDKVHGDDDDEGHKALRARHKVERAPDDRRAFVLLRAFRRMAALDSMDLKRCKQHKDTCEPLMPVAEECAAVPLARLTVKVRQEDGCVSVAKPKIRPLVRRALLPTATIQELLCALAPGVIGQRTEPDAGGPRLVPGSVSWHNRSSFTFEVDKELAPGSADGGISVSVLNRTGWSKRDIRSVQVSDDGKTVEVSVRHPWEGDDFVRVTIHGRGARPLYGTSPPVPFAGTQDDPPGTRKSGHDAVITTRAESH